MPPCYRIESRFLQVTQKAQTERDEYQRNAEPAQPLLTGALGHREGDHASHNEQEPKAENHRAISRRRPEVRPLMLPHRER